MLSPKEAEAGSDAALPVVIEHSALLENGFSSSGPCPDNVTLAFGFKPTSSTKAVLSDSTAHYALTIRKSGTTITAFKGAVVLKTYDGSFSPSSVADLVGQVLADLCGSTKGYYSRLVAVEGAHDPLLFWAVHQYVNGLYIPRSISGLSILTSLDFADASSLGNDASGNGNHWVVNGVQTMDTPTNNYCTWNTLQQSYYPTRPEHSYSDGNTIVTNTDSDLAFGTMWVHSGKWYWEYEIVNDPGGTFNLGIGGYAVVDLYNGNSRIHSNLGGDNVSTPYGESFASGDVMGVALDVENKSLEFFKNGISQGVLNFSIVPPYGLSPYTSLQPNAGGSVRLVSGSTGFTYTPPDGFMSLCAENMPDPEIMKTSKFADSISRVGNGVAASVQTDFAPDWVTTKNMDGNYNWHTVDTARGAGEVLFFDVSQVETAIANSVTSFDSGGCSLGSADGVNRLGDRYADLVLKADPAAGFDVVRYTGDGAASKQITHALGKKPTFMIVKALGFNGNWMVYHTALGATKTLFLDSSAVALTDIRAWNSTEPTSTHFTVGAFDAVNQLGTSYVAYLFTDSDVFKAFTYTGNGSVNGPFTQLGGKPLLVPFVKNTSSVSEWFHFDPERADGANTPYLQPSLSVAGGTAVGSHRWLSNGFKVTYAGGVNLNQNGDIYAGLAILQSAQKYSNAF
jgi:hypothetical protein